MGDEKESVMMRMIALKLFTVGLLLLAAGPVGAAEIRATTDLQADLSLARRQVVLSDLGLKDKEVLAARLFDGPLVKGKYPFDKRCS